MGKRPEYFIPGKIAWPDMLPEVARNISPVEVSSPAGDDLAAFQFVGAYNKNDKTEVITKMGVESVGQLSMTGWFEAVGASKAMVSSRPHYSSRVEQYVDGQLGIGEPYLSPSRKYNSHGRES